MTRPLAILALLFLLGLSPAPPRVLVIGDSLSRGAFASGPGATYAALVAAGLGAPGLVVQPTRDLPGAEAVWARVRGAGWDLVILEVGINDSISGPVTPAWRERYARLVASMAPATVVCVTPFDVGVEAISADLAARAAAIRQTPGCRVADVYEATRGRPELRAPVGALTFYGEGEAADAIHPNNAGHAVVADVILEATAWPTRTHLPLLR